MQNYLIAVDVGTTSTKCLAVTAGGSVIAKFNRGYPTYFPKPGYSEQNADEILEALVEVMAETTRHVGHQGILGISFSCAMHSLMAVDESCKPLTEVLIWGDTRSVAQAEDLRSSTMGQEINDITGTPIHPMTPLCSLLRLKQNEGELFSSACKFISIKEYIFAKFFGEYVVDHSIASGAGLFDHRQLKWSKKALDLIGIGEEKLSKLVSTRAIFSGISSDLATRMGIPADTSFVIGGSDGCLAQLGSDAMAPGDMSVTIGTSGAVRMATSEYQQDAKRRIFNYRLDEETYVVGGATNNGAVLLSWYTENLLQTKSDSESFVRDAFSVKSAEGLIFLPYLLGERAPIYDARARGVFFGIDIHHTDAHFKRAVLEGICWGLKSIAQALEEVVQPAGRVMASGGFAHSDQWVQLLSDILNKPIYVDPQTEASAMGAAMVGFKALGVTTDFKPREGKRFVPDTDRARYYQSVFEIVGSLYDNLKGDFAKLSNLN